MEPKKNLKVHSIGKPKLNLTQFVSPGIYTREENIWIPMTPPIEELRTRYNATPEFFSENFEEIKREMVRELAESLLLNNGVEFITLTNMTSDNIQITAKLKYIKQNNG